MAQLRIKRDVVAAVLRTGPDGDRARAQHFAAQARQVATEIQRNNDIAVGARVPREQLVDGRANAPLESVKPGGQVVFLWQFYREIVRELMTVVNSLAPVKTGRYRASFVIEADGVEVSSPDAVSTAREVVVYNRQPYARRLEPTWGSPRLSRMAPNGIMEVAEQRVRRRFGGVAAIKFSYATRSGEVVPIIKITPKSRRTQGIA